MLKEIIFFRRICRESVAFDKKLGSPVDNVAVCDRRTNIPETSPPHVRLHRTVRMG